MPVTGDNVRFDVPLSNLAVAAFQQPDDAFVGDKVFPEVAVPKRSDRYYTITKDGFLRAEDALRAPMTPARTVKWDASTDSFYCHNYALAAEHPMEDLALADTALLVRENSTRQVVGLLRLAQEIRVANICCSGTQCGSYVVLGSQASASLAQWHNTASADILGQVNTAHAFMRSVTGLLPNTAVMDWDSYQLARRNSRLLEMYKYTRGGELSDDVLREVFKVETILIGKGIKNTAKEGQSFATANIWGDVCWLGHVEPGTSLQTRTFGLRMSWRDPIYPSNLGVQRAIQADAGQRKVEIIEAGHFMAEKVVASQLGYLISDTQP